MLPLVLAATCFSGIHLGIGGNLMSVLKSLWVEWREAALPCREDLIIG